MRTVALGLAFVLVACGPTAQASSLAPTEVASYPAPTSTARANPTPSVTPSPSRPPLGLATEAVVATITPTEAGSFGLRVEAVSYDGGSRMITEFDLLELDGIEDYSLGYPFRLVASHESWLAVSIEAPPGLSPNRLQVVLIDLADRAARPFVLPVADAKLAWGPDGLLALDSQNLVVTLDPASHDQHRVDVPSNAGTLGAWTTDGSGWAATAYDAETESTTAGSVSAAGAFVPGRVSLYQATGTERFWSATGATLATAVGDGPTGAVTVVYEESSDPQRVWFTLREPSDDPRLGDMIWDAAGTGMWYLLDTGIEVQLAHRDAPESAYDIRATFPRTGQASFEGIAADDSSFVVSVGTELQGDIGELLWVDGSTGKVRSLGHPPNILAPPPIFAGWAGG